MLTKLPNSQMWSAVGEVLIIGVSKPIHQGVARLMVDDSNPVSEAAKDFQCPLILSPHAPGGVEGLPSVVDNAVFAGRLCYDSFHKPNKATAERADYLYNIAEQNHLSVLEHMHFSVLFTNVSRSFTHELVRHRHFSFSQESQRYVVQKPFIVVPPNASEAEAELLADQAQKAYETYLDMVKTGLSEGELTRKQVLEKARALLPSCFATRIVASGNLRSWVEFFQKRDSEFADAEMRAMAGQTSFEFYKYFTHNDPGGVNLSRMLGLISGEVEQQGPKVGA